MMDRVRLLFLVSGCNHLRVCVADIREFTPESWRNIIGVVPQVRNQHEQCGFVCHLTNSFSLAYRTPYCLLEP